MEIKYKIMNMEESGFYLKPDYDYSAFDKEKINFQFFHQFDPVIDKELLNLKMIVEITPFESNEVLVREEIFCSFSIIPYDKVIQVKEGGFTTSEPTLINTFISIAIGALRGMLVKNTKGSYLSGCVMPLIPMSVINENMLQSSHR